MSKVVSYSSWFQNAHMNQLKTLGTPAVPNSNTSGGILNYANLSSFGKFQMKAYNNTHPGKISILNS
jgi:hypothetical protein